MNIITYHSSNAKPHEAWLAYVELANGEQWLVRCTGHSELEAKTKAQVLWDRERAKYKVHNELVDNAVAEMKKVDCQGEQPKRIDGRGAHASAMFAGKMWMINRATHHLCRIDPSELTVYEAKGYVRGGPRSK
jgi:hypothetical protein